MLVSPRSAATHGLIDDALAAIGLRRFVALSVTRLTTLPAILAASDLIACVPSRFADRPEVRALTRAHDLPFASPDKPQGGAVS